VCSSWKALPGPTAGGDVPPGLSARRGSSFCDVTKVKRRGDHSCGAKPFPQPACSTTAWPEAGGPTARVVHGGESFCGSLEGFAERLAACEVVCQRGCARIVLSAAGRQFRDGSYARQSTPRYQALCAHYTTCSQHATTAAWPRETHRRAPHGHVKNGGVSRSCCCAQAVISTEAGRIRRAALRGVQLPSMAPTARRYEGRSFEGLGTLPAFRISQITQLADLWCCVSTSTIRGAQGRLLQCRRSLMGRSGHVAAAPNDRPDRFTSVVTGVCQFAQGSYGSGSIGPGWCIDLDHLRSIGLRAKPRALLQLPLPTPAVP